jgi:predicted DNA-binding transcriptional regulator YafY
LRAWSRQGRKLLIRYIDESGCVSVRVLWPFEVEDTSDVQVLMAWCELSSDFRTFHIDHIASVTYLEQRYPEHSADLRRRWLKTGRPEHAVR